MDYPSIFIIFKYETHEKMSSTTSFLGSHKGLLTFAAVRFEEFVVSEEPPTAALKINDALSTNIFVTSSADLV